ncbi:MAG: flagellar assembly protein A [Planctomycetota bacterium]
MARDPKQKHNPESPRATRRQLAQQAKGTHLLRRQEAGAGAADPGPSGLDGPASSKRGVAAPARNQGRGRIEALIRKVVQVGPDGLSAVLFLPGGVAIPPALLRKILKEMGVCAGVDQAALEAAGRPETHERRLVVAQALVDDAGRPQRNVFGRPVAAQARSLRLELDAQEMEATLHLHQHHIDLDILRKALQAHRVVYGLDKTVIAELIQRRGPVSGSFVVASGLEPVWPRAAGFRFGQGGCAQILDRVAAGDRLARWQPGAAGRKGCTVTGSVLPVPDVPEPRPDVQAGLGTTLAGTRQDEYELHATRDGVCYQKVDGTVVVSEVHEIRGDLGSDSPPVTTNEVVIVHGDIADGNTVTCTSDLLVRGDVGDAHLTIGGSLMVEGRIGPGMAAIAVAEAMTARAIERRLVQAGSVRVTGVVRDSKLTVMEDLDIDHAIGGVLTAGGSIRLREVGDHRGTKTKLWAGRDVNGGNLAGLRRLQVSGKVRQRHAALEDLSLTRQRLDTVIRSLRRLKQAAYINPEQARWIQGQAIHLNTKAEELEDRCEELRSDIAGDHRKHVEAVDAALDETEASMIEVSGATHRNVGMKFSTLTTRYFHQTGHHVRDSLRARLLRRDRDEDEQPHPSG